MTDNQKFKLYFPAWSDAVSVNHWRMEKKRLVIEQDRLTAEGKLVVDMAYKRAAMDHRGPVVDDIRRACHIVAIGKDKSSKDLNNAELDRVVTLMRLITDPENLSARMKWDAYQRGEDPGALNRIEYIIRKAPEAYARAVSAGKFGTKDWENLTYEQKRQLSMTLANRDPRRPSTAMQPAGSAAAEDPDWTV